MLLKDFKAISAIDAKIDDMHAQLKGLYDVRARYAASDKNNDHKISPKQIFKQEPLVESWAVYEHKRLEAAWSKYGITIPSLADLQDPINNAKHVIHTIQMTDSIFEYGLGLMLVPPASVFKVSKLNEFRLHQGLGALADSFDPAISVTYRNKNWKLYVVFNALTGMNLGSVKDIMEHHRYSIAGFDTRGLGPYEYAAFTLQHPTIIDRNEWTLLLKGYKSGDAVSASFVGNRYCFAVDDANGLGDERFRPAIEVA